MPNLCVPLHPIGEADVTTMSIRPRGIAEILDGAFRLYREDFGLYAFTAVLGAIPWAVFMVAAVGTSDATAVFALLLLPVALVTTIAVWAALMHQMDQRLGGDQPALGQSLKFGVRMFFHVALGGILSYIVIVGAVFVVMFGGLIAGLLIGLANQWVGVLVGTVVAVVALVTVGFRAVAGSVLFLPGVVVERLNGYRSLRRGFELAKGGRGRIVSVTFLSWVLVFVPFMATYFVTGTTATLIDPEAMANGVVGAGQFAAQQMLGVIASGFTTPFLVACILLMYYDQRVRLEAYDLEAEAEALGG